ncbi:MAG: bifunctional 4-hydroxy-2-oxoglutarate aldolase/2-dehydro-3-deoxy-phosphogluconate aldolase [Oscillospiraceae bacterium]
MKQLIREHPLIAILRNVPLSQTLQYAQAVFDGGIHAFEIALNSPDALRQIELLRKQYGETAEIGAGTALTVRKARDALLAGATFLLTPSSTPEVLTYCCENKVKLLPGVMTPTDVSVCVNNGFHTLKLFPAGDLPKNYIKSLQGPFDDTEYVAVGGVNKDNIQSFFERGFVGVGIGSNLIPKEYIENNEWEKAKEYVQALVSHCMP